MKTDTWLRFPYAKKPYADSTLRNMTKAELIQIIRDYEHHALAVTEEGITIDGEPADSYTFSQDYYFMMGDNRHNSLDSRYWGFVPEDHVVGLPLFIWFSSDGNRSFPGNIRWRRFFKFV